MKHIQQAFTLVELIVVVTILAILATIGFVSYSGYLTGVRDTNRVASLTAISDGLELYRTKNDLPLPDSSVEVQVESETIARQGYAGSNVLQTIEYSKAGKDPKDDQYYSYYLTDDKKHYQMMAFLEESDNLETNIITQTNAATDYSNRHPKVYGKRLGILTDENNTPIQEISAIKTDGNLNMTGGTSQVYSAKMGDNIALVGSGGTLGSLKSISQLGGAYSSCTIMATKKKDFQAGIYPIIGSDGSVTNLYCNPEGLVAEWLFDDADKLGKDTSGYDNNLIASNDGVLFNQNGKINSSIQFPGDIHMNTSNKDELSLFKEFSYSFWFKRSGDSLYTWPNPLMNGNSNHHCFGARSHNYSQTMNFERAFAPFTGVSGTYSSAGTFNIDDETWYHIVMAYNGNIISIYANGLLTSTINLPPLSPLDRCSNIRVGSSVKGNMDNIRIYNRALIPSEVADLYKEGTIQ